MGDKTKIILWLLVLILLITIFYYLGKINIPEGGIENIFLNKYDEKTEVCIKEKCYVIELAITNDERTQGLMFREELKANEGMLFVYENEGIYGFWMKNTLIPLDIIWIDKNNKIVFIKENAEPCTEEYSSCTSIIPNKEAKYVLEINAGEVNKNNIIIGDGVRMNNINNQQSS